MQAEKTIFQKKQKKTKQIKNKPKKRIFYILQFRFQATFPLIEKIPREYQLIIKKKNCRHKYCRNFFSDEKVKKQLQSSVSRKFHHVYRINIIHYRSGYHNHGH